MKLSSFKFKFKLDDTVRADTLVKQAVLPLHHHMAPGDEDEDENQRG